MVGKDGESAAEQQLAKGGSQWHAAPGSALSQYYVAVDRQQFKLSTLVDLTEVLVRSVPLPVVIACGSRDVLDVLAATLSPLPGCIVAFLHSDQGEAERTAILALFREAVAAWSAFVEGRTRGYGAAAGGVAAGEARRDGAQAHILVVTDACLPLQQLGEAPLNARLLINYDIPPKKEAYMRRVGACISQAAASASTRSAGQGHAALSSSHHHASGHTGGLIITFVTAGEIAVLRNLEESCGFSLPEMPIHISELL